MFSRIFRPRLLLLAHFAPVWAAVDLVTLPTREGTQLFSRCLPIVPQFHCRRAAAAELRNNRQNGVGVGAF